MHDLYERFDHLDTRLNQWLVAHSIRLLRISLGLIYLVFGVLKYFPGVSPIQDLAIRTTTVLTFGLLTPSACMILVATLEVAIGLCFVSGRFLRIGVWLMLGQLVGAMAPLVLFSGELFPGPLHTPTLVAQYIVKDVVLVAAAMVLAATWTGARIMAEPSSMRRSLGTGLQPVGRVTQVPHRAALRPSKSG